MAGGVTIKFNGSLDQLSVKRLQKNVADALSKFGRDVDREAKQLAPVDEGALRSAIFNTPATADNLTVSFGCNIFYAAYVEFGTRKFAAKYVATLPTEWKAYAAQYKGKGGAGTFDEFLKNIIEWVMRKGIGGTLTKSGNVSKSADSKSKQEQAAYVIAMSILRNGIKPHPFLYPAYLKARAQLMQELKKIGSK